MPGRFKIATCNPLRNCRAGFIHSYLALMAHDKIITALPTFYRVQDCEFQPIKAEIPSADCAALSKDHPKSNTDTLTCANLKQSNSSIIIFIIVFTPVFIIEYYSIYCTMYYSVIFCSLQMAAQSAEGNGSQYSIHTARLQTHTAKPDKIALEKHSVRVLWFGLRR